MKRILGLIVLLAICFVNVKAQEVGIKTNLLYDATASVNLGVEVGLAPQWTLDISGDFNSWDVNRHKWKHWFAQPEARYWFCDRFAKWFLAFHAVGGQFNVGNISGLHNFLGTHFGNLKENRYQGWGIGGGVGAGYAAVLGKHWNLEFELALGYIWLKYDRYQCADCGKKMGSGHHNYYGPTKAAINLVYLF